MLTQNLGLKFKDDGQQSFVPSTLATTAQDNLSMDYGTLRRSLGMHRLLTSAFSTLASALVNTNIEHALPILKPVVATPPLLAEVMHDFLVQCYSDKKLMQSLLASRDLNLLANHIIFRDVVLDISESLEEMFRFVDRFSLDPILSSSLRMADEAAFYKYAKRK